MAVTLPLVSNCIASLRPVVLGVRRWASTVGTVPVAVLPRPAFDRALAFDAVRHQYMLHGRPAQSVTRLIASLFAPFNADEIIAKQYPQWQLDVESKYFGMSAEDIKRTWLAHGQQAAQSGTLLHSRIERFLANGDRDGIAVDIPFGHAVHFLDDHRHLVSRQRGYEVERRVIDPVFRIAGTVDLIARQPDDAVRYPGKVIVSLFDWKRTEKDLLANATSYGRFAQGLPALRHVKENSHSRYALQLNLYRSIIQRNYEGIVVDEMYVVQCSPANGAYNAIPIVPMDLEVDAILDHRRRRQGLRDAP